MNLLIEYLSLLAFSRIAKKNETLASRCYLLFQCMPETTLLIESIFEDPWENHWL